MTIFHSFRLVILNSSLYWWAVSLQAFHPMYDELVKHISKRILNTSENGTVNNLLKEFLPNYDNACDGYTLSGSGQLDVYNIWGLFIMSGLVIFIVLLLYMVRRKWKPSLIPTATSRQASASHGRGGFNLKNTVQFLRKARLSLNPSERRTIVIAPAQVTVNHSGSTPLWITRWEGKFFSFKYSTL